MSENNNNNNNGSSNDLQDGKDPAATPRDADPPQQPHRERSPSATSQGSVQSTGLEWDPSADVGHGAAAAHASTSTSSAMHHHYPPHGRGASHSREFQSATPVNVLFGPTFDAKGQRKLHGSSRPSSQISQRSNLSVGGGGHASTPSASPVPPLPILDYSPVTFGEAGGSQRRQGASGENSSESNNNTATDNKRTPPSGGGERTSAASDASTDCTDWEYGKKKKASSSSNSSATRHVPDWQTHGVTRSEIEYQIKKKSQNGSSSSAPSSLYLLQVEAHMRSQSSSRPPSTPSPHINSSPEESSSRKIQNDDQVFKKPPLPPPPPQGGYQPESLHHHHRRHPPETSDNSSSDPSSMCAAINKFLQIVDEKQSKEGTNVKYEVLRSHRDYHLHKVSKQIARLEKLNRALLAYKGKSTKPKEYVEVEVMEEIPVAHHSHRVHHRRQEQEPPSTSAKPKMMTEPESRKDPNDRKKPAEKIKRKSPIGFFIPLVPLDEDDEDGAGVLRMEEAERRKRAPEQGAARKKREFVGASKAIEEYLKERNPECYKNIKERDHVLTTVKRERLVHNETVLREALQRNVALEGEEMDEFLRRHYRHLNHDLDERRRLKAFWEWYAESRKENEGDEGGKREHVISTREMKERTQKLRMNDPAMMAKRKREAEERKRKANVAQKRLFSTNLRQFQKMAGGVNVPDRLKLGPLPR